MIEIQFLGAACNVTGSKHLIKTSQTQVLLDCGLFQGHREEAFEKNRHLPIEVKQLGAVVLSHAHIDHSGALPALVRMGYRGSIYATSATRDLCTPMLMDTAHIMESDALYIEHLIAKGVRGLKKIDPLYAQSDVLDTLNLMIGLPYHHRQSIAPGVHLTFLDAGHVLGSAISVLDIEDGDQQIRLAFTGDLGRKHLPILRDPEVPEGIHYLLSESTYGDRLHDSMETAYSGLEKIITKTCARGGKVVIPTFALERAQEIIYVLKQLREQDKIAKIPVYVDSPLTVKLTEIFKLHPECYDSKAIQLLESRDPPFEFSGLRYINSVEESKEIDQENQPSIILSASGMCEGGRILHHLKSTVENPSNTILIVGYQAEHTLGRRLLEKRKNVKIFGNQYRLKAEVEVLSGFSAHADQTGLLNFAQAVQEKGDLKQIFLVHGEKSSQQVLAQKLQEKGFKKVSIPKNGEQIQLV